MRSARFWENLPSWFTIPMKHHISVILVEGSMSVMADVFFGSTRCPRNFSCVFPISHLLGFTVTPAGWILRRASVRHLLCSAID